MRILVDRDRCEGNAKCAQLAPAVFIVDDSEQVQIIGAPDEHRKAVEAAVARCPRQALMIDESP